MRILSGTLVGERTEGLLPLDDANRVAASLAATGRYDEVRAVESPRAKSADVRWFVFMKPGPAEVAEILREKQEERRASAEREGPNYVWVEDTDHPFWHCKTTSEDGFYEVSEGDCSCPDYQQTCKYHGMRCKHMLAGDLGLGDRFSRDYWTTNPAEVLKAAYRTGAQSVQAAKPFNARRAAAAKPKAPAVPTPALTAGGRDRATFLAQMAQDFPD